MSGEFPVEDTVSPAAQGGRATAPGQERGELVKHGINSVDGITFASMKMRFRGNITVSGHEIILEDGNRELRFMSSLNESGEVTSALEIISDKTRAGEYVEGHIALYLLTDEKITKLLDGKYRGKFKEFATYDDFIEFVQQRRQVGMTYEKVEE